MNAEEFVEKIIGLKPTSIELVGLEYPNGLLDTWLKEFTIKKKATVEYDNQILTIIKNYDVSSLNINDITFDNNYFDDGEHFCFGWDATGDRLAIYKPNGKIVAYDVYGDRITFQCAESAEKFLDALLEIMKFVREKILNNYDEETRDKRSKDVAYIASLRAGGEEYEDYYKSVLWVE
jgi:hypothetical protein